MNTSHKYISGILIGSVFFGTLPIVFAEEAQIPTLSCEYSGKFQQCIEANRNGDTRSIKDFVCLQSNSWEAILDQIILDVEFQEIDDEVYDYLDRLSKDKELPVNDPNRAIDDVTKALTPEGVYYKKYKKLCNGGILAKRADCTEKIPNTTAGVRLQGSNMSQECITLVKNKLDIYTKVADGVLKLNKGAVIQDDHQEYVQQERTKYDELLNDMNMIIGSAGRLARGVTHWTPNPLQGVILESIISKFSRFI